MSSYLSETEQKRMWDLYEYPTCEYLGPAEYDEPGCEDWLVEEE